MKIEDDEQRPRKKSKSKLPEQVPYLVPEIITEILSRLPVKSLLRFRSVSKLWRYLISDPKFVKTHLSICSKDDEISHHKLIFRSSCRFDIYVKSCHISPVLNRVSVYPMELDYPLKRKKKNRPVFIVGSVNGLVCFGIDEVVMFLWNPSTRISRAMPPSGIKLHREHLIVYGFGYDESTDDYKVVGIFGTFHSEHLFKTDVMVYSSRADDWRRIGDFPLGIPVDETGKFVNGAVHWAACRNTGSKFAFSWLIVSFDLANETYGEVAQPSYGEGEFELSSSVLGKCLCVLSTFHGYRTDVWIMKEYGVRESWTKLTTITYTFKISKYEHPVLLYLSKNGEILLEFGTHIVLYNPQSKSFKNTDMRSFDKCREANIYVESLVSPFTQEGLERQQ